MQKLTTTTKVYNPQTGMEAEVLEVTPDTVTFRSLPVGRPSTTAREKFEAVFRIINPEPTTQSSDTQKIPKPKKTAAKKPKKRGRKKKKGPAVYARMDPETKRVLEKAYRKRRYKVKAPSIRKQSLEHYYKVKAEIEAGLRPPKILSEEERLKRNQYQREYRVRNRDKMKASQKRRRLAQRPTPRKRSTAPPKEPIDKEDTLLQGKS